MENTDRVLIVGGGIGGLTAAIALAREGIPAHVFEKVPDLEEVGAGVSLWPNAMRVFGELGMAEVVKGERSSLERILLLRTDGTPLRRMEGPGRHSEPAICLHRADLQNVLAREVPRECLHLGRRAVDFVEDGNRIRVLFQDGSEEKGILLVGCDGIHSMTRARMHGTEAPRYRGYEIWRGVTDLELPEELLGQATEWWGPGRRFGILPGEAGRVYWYATRSGPRPPEFRRNDGPGRSGAPEPESDSPEHGAPENEAAEPGSGTDEDSENGLRRLRAAFDGWPFPAPQIIAEVGDAAVLTPAMDRPVPRRWGRGRVTLLGDAAHPMTPNMGQGSCSAVEDALVLARCLAKEGPGPVALRRYEDLREKRTRWIVRNSRRVGAVGQLRHPLLVAVRDRLLPLLPDVALEWGQDRIYGYRVNEATGRTS